MTLYDLDQGDEGIITRVRGRGAFRKRIIEMGFIVGKKVSVVKKAPLKDPVEYHILGYNVTLRNSEAQLIEVVTQQDILEVDPQAIFEGTLDENLLKLTEKNRGNNIHIALVGNPNSGKTSLFNFASHSKERVGNYSGVTVDAKLATFSQDGYRFQITDLPGTYSITAYTPEELFVRNYIFDEIPDIVVNVIDATNIERNLYLTTQLIDMDIKVVVALNMHDEFKKSGDKLNYQHLGDMLGIPFVPTVGSKGTGIQALFSKIIQVYEERDPSVRHIHINYGHCIEKGIARLQNKINTEKNRHLTAKISSRFLAIKMLEKDHDAAEQIKDCSNSKEIEHLAQREINRIEKVLANDSETLITDAKYGFIAGALKETLIRGHEKRAKKSDRIDTILTHKIWGIPIFIFAMWLTFYSTFKLGQYPMNWLERMVSWLSAHVDSLLPTSMLKNLIIDGIIGGVGGVLVFLPNILILYLFIAIMEDTGYMARAVFIMDKVMHKIGLHGKSFIPLMMGFGCNVPAILSTRIIESRRDRLMTMLINPFMSCSARLPVYILFISAFFNQYQGAILFGMYTTGVLIAIGSALLFKKTILKTEDVPFVMELPPYRLPSVRSMIRHMWHRTEQYLKKITGVILIASIIIWALGYFPRNHELIKTYEQELTHIEQNNGLNSVKTAQLKEELTTKIKSQQQEYSYIGRIGNVITPALRPLGFDWKMSIAILTGVAAKEITVGTLGVLHQASNHGEHTNNLVEKLRNQRYTTGPHEGEHVFTPLVALSFMLFILIYFPCIAVVAAIHKESNSWKYPLFTVVYTTSLAYIISLIVYQTGLLLGF